MSMINYETIEQSALLKIRNIRAEYSDSQVVLTEESMQAFDSVLFDYSVRNHSLYEFVNKQVEEYLYDLLEKIIMNLCVNNNIKVTNTIQINTINGKKTLRLKELFALYKNAPLFAIVINEENELVMYCFKKFGIQNQIPEYKMSDILHSVGIQRYHYISLVEKNAYAEIINFKENEKDESKGTNRYSIKWFFENFFGIDEYIDFKNFEDSLTNKIKSYLGFAVVKNLTPNALFSFKKNVQEEITSFDYERLLVTNGNLSKELFQRIKSQYIDERYYTAMLNEESFSSISSISGCEFSKSFITAEWLYQSMSSTGKMDLTSIAMGFFKSIEQLLFVFVSTHANENKWIDTYNRPENWKDYPPYKRKWQSRLDISTLKAKKNFIMQERMIHFLEDYDDLFFDVLVRPCLIEYLKDAQQLRNGYFHKDNLSDPNIVIKARNDAFVISFLLLGSMCISEEGKKILGIPTDNNHYEDLCDYINNHQHQTYYYEDNNVMVVAVGQPDNKVLYDDNGVYGVGISDTLAKQMAFKLQSIGILCTYHSGLNEQYVKNMNDPLNNVSIFISLTGKNDTIKSILQILKKKKIYTFAILPKTTENLSQLCRDYLMFDMSIFKDIESMCSIFAAEYIINIIYTTLAYRRQITRFLTTYKE